MERDDRLGRSVNWYQLSRAEWVSIMKPLLWFALFAVLPIAGILLVRLKLKKWPLRDSVGLLLSGLLLSICGMAIIVGIDQIVSDKFVQGWIAKPVLLGIACAIWLFGN